MTGAFASYRMPRCFYFACTMVYLLLSKEGAVRITEDGIEGWCADPYDPVYKRGCLMNCSERKSFDEEFPQHPLTELRRFVKELADLN